MRIIQRFLARRLLPVCGAAAFGLAAVVSGHAQVAAPPDRLSTSDHSPTKIPEATGPGMSGSSTEPLGDKLNRTGGVINPPTGTDRDMAQPPPPVDPKSTPVIPPPGTPGGKPGVNPK